VWEGAGRRPLEDGPSDCRADVNGKGIDCNLQRVDSVTANIIRAIRSGRMRWAGRVTRMGDRRGG
jgi:hypothetical protein